MSVIELDYMEYSTDELAQAAYMSSDTFSWDLLDEDCADISDWEDRDAINGESTQVTFDGKSCFKFDTNIASHGNIASRLRDYLSLSNNYTLEIKLYLDAISDNHTNAFDLAVRNGVMDLRMDFRSSGLFIYDGLTYNEVGTDLVVQDQWQTWRFEVTGGSADTATCDVYLNDELKASGVDCSQSSPYNQIWLTLLGSDDNDRIAYIDYIKIGTGLYSGNLRAYSEDTIKTQGSYSLKVEAKQTDSLDDTLTKSGLSIDLSGRDTLKLDARASRIGTNLQAQLKQLDYGSDTIPTMTSNTTPEGVASASNEVGAGWEAYRAFDDILTIPNYAGWLASGATNQWVRYQFVSGKVIRKVQIVNGQYDLSSDRGARHCKLEGSNNGSDWTKIPANGWDGVYATQYNTDEFELSQDVVHWQWITFNNSTSYTYYRIFCYDNWGDANFTGITEIEMMEVSYTKHTKDIAISSADSWETKTWDISGISDADKDNINQIVFKILNADLDTDYFIDNFFAEAISEEISSDAYIISYATQQSINSLAFINNDITADAWVKEVLSDTISSDANIRGTISQEILSDAEIAPVGREYSTILSDANIKGVVEQIISSDAHIKATISPIISSDAHIYVYGAPEITSDAYIKRIIQESINSDTYISYYKDFYAKLRAQVDIYKDFNLQLKVNQPAPTNPTGLTATDTQTGESLILNWTDTGNYGYNIYKDVSGAWIKQNDTLVRTNSYIAGSLVTGVNYTFQVRGVNGIDEESSGVNTSGTPTYNIERYKNPSFQIYIGGALRDDAVLERVDLVYGPSFSEVTFYIPKNPDTAGLPEINNQEVKVYINNRLVFTGVLLKRNNSYDARNLKVSYTALNKLWEKTLNTVGVGVARPLEYPKELWNPLQIADLTELEFMQSSLRYKGNYKIHCDAFGNISYYKVGSPISTRTYQVGKHILRQDKSEDSTSPETEVTVYSGDKTITKSKLWKSMVYTLGPFRGMTNLFKMNLSIGEEGKELSDVKVFAYINDEPEVTEHIKNVQVLPGHMSKSEWRDGGSEGRYPIKAYTIYRGRWTSVSAKIEYSVDGKRATITTAPLPRYFSPAVEGGNAEFKTPQSIQSLFVRIWSKPISSIAVRKIVYTYKEQGLSASAGIGIARRTYHENIIPYEINVPSYLPYEYKSQTNVPEVVAYLQARADEESAKYSLDINRGTMTIFGDETLTLRTKVNGMEVARITHEFTSSGFLSHLDLTTESFYKGIAVFNRQEMLMRKNKSSINKTQIITLTYDSKKIEALLGEQRDDFIKDPQAGIAGYSD